MPEGPQIVILKEQTAHFIGQKVIKAEGIVKDIPFNKKEDRQLIDIKTFGKEILFCFPHFTIRVHLMLFGQYVIDDKLNRDLTLRLQFEEGIINFYASSCKLILKNLDELYDWSADVLNKSFSVDKALQKLKRKPNELICEALLNQKILAGVGNKIKNEVLFRRRIHPESIVGKIPEKEQKRLIEECVKLSEEYLQWKREGEENEHWQVYKKLECPRDHIPIRKDKPGKSRRSSYFCDKCQQLYLQEEL